MCERQGVDGVPVEGVVGETWTSYPSLCGARKALSGGTGDGTRGPREHRRGRNPRSRGDEVRLRLRVVRGSCPGRSTSTTSCARLVVSVGVDLGSRTRVDPFGWKRGQYRFPRNLVTSFHDVENFYHPSSFNSSRVSSPSNKTSPHGQSSSAAPRCITHNSWTQSNVTTKKYATGSRC